MNVEYTVSSGNVFADLGIPDAADALVKADLAIEMAATIKKRHLIQAQAAKVMGIDQSRVSRASCVGNWIDTASTSSSGSLPSWIAM